MLLWAIDRAGLNLPDFSKSLPVEKWLSGKRSPTQKQLEKFSKKVRVPYGFLFLDSPPREEIPISFFRSNASGQTSISINVLDTIQSMQRRQNWLREYLTRQDTDPLEFVGSYSSGDQVRDIVSSVRSTLKLDETWASKESNWQDTLNKLVECIETTGIMTVFNGVVGNNTSRKIEVDECRGFVLVDEYAPLIFVNNSDAKSAQLFTIAHELAHIWLGESAGFDFEQMLPADDPIEKLCDQVAAEFLVPKTILLKQAEQDSSLEHLKKFFKVSNIVIARRLLDTGFYTRSQFLEFYNDYRAKVKERGEKKSDGGNFYATNRRRVSPLFARYVYSAVRSGDLLYRDAYRLTDLRGDTFEKFMEKVI